MKYADYIIKQYLLNKNKYFKRMVKDIGSPWI